jgi:hypothetical protein
MLSSLPALRASAIALVRVIDDQEQLLVWLA